MYILDIALTVLVITSSAVGFTSPYTTNPSTSTNPPTKIQKDSNPPGLQGGSHTKPLDLLPGSTPSPSSSAYPYGYSPAKRPPSAIAITGGVGLFFIQYVTDIALQKSLFFDTCVISLTGGVKPRADIPEIGHEIFDLIYQFTGYNRGKPRGTIAGLFRSSRRRGAKVNAERRRLSAARNKGQQGMLDYLTSRGLHPDDREFLEKGLEELRVQGMKSEDVSQIKMNEFDGVPSGGVQGFTRDMQNAVKGVVDSIQNRKGRKAPVT